VETASNKVVGHLLAELYARKWLVGIIPLSLNFVLSKPLSLLNAAAVTNCEEC